MGFCPFDKARFLRGLVFSLLAPVRGGREAQHPGLREDPLGGDPREIREEQGWEGGERAPEQV